MKFRNWLVLINYRVINVQLQHIFLDFLEIQINKPLKARTAYVGKFHYQLTFHRFYAVHRISIFPLKMLEEEVIETAIINVIASKVCLSLYLT